MPARADGWRLTEVAPKGNVTGCACAADYTTTFDYTIPGTTALNQFGDVQTVIDPLGHATVFSYDADRRKTAVTDPNGNTTTHVYDRDGEPTTVGRADSPQTTLVTDYNGDATVADQKNGAGVTTLAYGYDPLGRRTSVTDALSNTTVYAYDGAGNVTSRQDPGGNCGATPKTGCTTYSYNAGNQLTGISYSDGVTPNVTGISYDDNGRRTAMTDGTGTSSWTYDSLGRMTSSTLGTGAPTVGYGYDLGGNMTAITYPGNHTVTRGFDDAGRLHTVQDWLSNTTAFTYDANSNLTTQTLPAGTGVVDSFTVNDADQLTGINDSNTGGSLFAATYSRDNNGQLASDSSAPTGTSSYQYNALNQLCYAGSSNTTACNVPPTGATTYSYDSGDNATGFAGSTQAFNTADQLCWTVPGSSTNPCSTPPSGATTFSYDAKGNRTSVTPPSPGSSTTLTYDQENRLSAYGTTATYSYNGDGLRTSKTVGTTTTAFVWTQAGSLPLLLSDGTTSVVYGPGGLPLEQIDNSGTVTWMHHDQLGSTRLLTDSSGTTVGSTTYDPYGNITATSGTITPILGYAGQYTDPETGLQYLRARYYDRSTGQFLSRDPVSSTTRDAYGYALRSPLSATDPSGLYSADTAEHYLEPGMGYTMVNAPWCEGGFGFEPGNDSNWRQLNPRDMAAYAYVHMDDLKREGQLPENTGDRLAPSVLKPVVDFGHDVWELSRPVRWGLGLVRNAAGEILDPVWILLLPDPMPGQDPCRRRNCSA